MSTLITYKIESDQDDKLWHAARLACSFWNKFVEPGSSIVIRLGTFTKDGLTIARAYKPYAQAGVKYGLVEFNTNYLSSFTEDEIVGTIIHEIGHSLGIGWDIWKTLFSKDTGKFTAEAISKLPALASMSVELDYDLGTTLVHWDEAEFGSELMTGLKGGEEHVLPVTVSIMGLLGNTVVEELSVKTELSTLLDQLRTVVFSRTDEAEAIDRDYFEKTGLWEETLERPKK